jgi:hypothetical protein
VFYNNRFYNEICKVRMSQANADLKLWNDFVTNCLLDVFF